MSYVHIGKWKKNSALSSSKKYLLYNLLKEYYGLKEERQGTVGLKRHPQAWGVTFESIKVEKNQI